jgi:hypothetical protein
MKVLTFWLLPILLVSVALGTASAGSVTYNFDLPITVFAPTNLFNDVVTLPDWNPALFVGQSLTSVDFSIDGAIQGTITLSNSANAPSAGTGKGTTLTDMFVYATPCGGTINAQVCPAELGDNTLSFTTGNQTLNPGQAQTYPSTGVFSTSGLLYDSGAITGGGVNAYKGAGNFSVYVVTDAALAVSGGGGQFGGSQSTQAGVGGTVTYNYSASTVTPEPVSMALLGCGLAALGLFRRKRLVR